MNVAAITQETLDLAKAGLVTDDATMFAKTGVTLASGLTYYDLEAPSKLIFPTPSPLRNKLPRVMGSGDSATHWKALLTINASNIHPGVGEGNRGAILTHTWTSFTAPYATIGLEEAVTFEAEQAAMGFDNARAKAAILQLKNCMRSEEYVILGGNYSLLMGITPTPTGSFTVTGGFVPDGAYYLKCVALGPDGYAHNATVSATGVIQQFTKTNADLTTETVNGNSAQPSANSSVITCTGGGGTVNQIQGYVTPVLGAVAYAWYVGTVGALKLHSITTINSVVISTLPSGTNQDSSTLVAADYSKQSLIFDGLLTYACTAGSNAYVRALATGVPGTGTTLTSDGACGIAEFTTAFQSFYDNYRLSPTHIWLHSSKILKVKFLVVLNNNYPLVRMVAEATSAFDLVTGIRGLIIVNPITGDEVKVMVHPFMPPGTILFETDTLPYEVTDVPAPNRIKTQREYYSMMWPLRTRKWESGTYCTELLQCYAPFSLGVIYNVA